MKVKIALTLFFFYLLQQARGQNWAPVPCYNGSAQIAKMFVDSLHNELVINCIYGHTVCNVTYKGMVAYNSDQFHDLDFGLDKYDPNPYTAGDKTLDCIPFNGKTLYGGYFASVGSNTLYSEAMALWNGAAWNTFPISTFTSNPSRSGYFPLVNGFLRDNGKLWVYGAFKNLGGIPGDNIYTFDGNTFTSANIPVSNFDYNFPINKMVKYKNQIYALGGFDDYPSPSMSRLAKYDGVSWTSVGNGIVGSLDNGYDMIVYNDTLYIGGAISKASGNAGNYIMKWDGTQLSDAGFGGFDGWWSINKLLVYRDRLYALGNFDTAAGQKAFDVAFYENGAWTVPQDSIAGKILTAAIYNDEIYIGGIFTSINGDPSMKNFAKLRCPNFDMANGCLSGIAENSLQNNLIFFPNPVKEKLTLDFKNINAEINSLSITNSIGQIVFQSSKLFGKQEVNLSFLSAGVYYLKVQSNEGSKTFKVLKE